MCVRARLGDQPGLDLVLNDGVSDLTSNTDHDLKSRTRALIAEVDALIDENDPPR